MYFQYRSESDWDYSKQQAGAELIYRTRQDIKAKTGERIGTVIE